MTVKELIEQLQMMPQDQEVYYRKVGGVGDIQAARRVVASSYSFFGGSIPCIIIEPEKDEE